MTVEKSSPLVSLVIPVFNVIPYLEQALKSVEAQTYRDIEVIAVDDGSTDGSGELLDGRAGDLCFPMRVVHGENAGVSAARNAGIDASSGAYIAFLDADDIIGPYHLERLVRAATESHAELAITGLTTFRDGERSPMRQPRLVSCASLTRGETICEALEGSPRFHSHIFGKLYARRLWEGVRFPEGRAFGEDQSVFYKVALKAGAIVYEDANDYFYRVSRPGSASSAAGYKKYAHMLQFLEALDEEREVLKTEMPEALCSLERNYSRQLPGAVFQAIRLGDGNAFRLRNEARARAAETLFDRSLGAAFRLKYAFSLLPLPLSGLFLRVHDGLWNPNDARNSL